MFEFLAIVRLGRFPDKRTAEADANARFGPAKLFRVESELNYLHADMELRAIRKPGRQRFPLLGDPDE